MTTGDVPKYEGGLQASCCKGWSAALSVVMHCVETEEHPESQVSLTNTTDAAGLIGIALEERECATPDPFERSFWMSRCGVK